MTRRQRRQRRQQRQRRQSAKRGIPPPLLTGWRREDPPCYVQQEELRREAVHGLDAPGLVRLEEVLQRPYLDARMERHEQLDLELQVAHDDDVAATDFQMIDAAQRLRTDDRMYRRRHGGEGHDIP